MRVILAVVALLSWPSDRNASGMGLASADDASLATDARVRVTAPSVSDRRLVGRLVAANESSLTVAFEKKIVTVPRQALTSLEVSRRPSRKGRGAGIGLLVGAAAGALLGYSEGRKGYAPALCSFLPPCDSVGHEYDHRADDAASYARAPRPGAQPRALVLTEG